MNRGLVFAACALTALPLVAAAAGGQQDHDDLKTMQAQIKQLQASARTQKKDADALTQKVQQLQRRTKADQLRVQRKNQRIEELRKQLNALSTAPAHASRPPV